jgi:tetratricopeptide (TPR) repeat protein
VGGGAGGFNALFEGQRPVGFPDEPVYAHSDYLNTLADYGAVGFGLLFGAAALVAGRCAGARGLAGAAGTGLLAFALHLAVDFHLKIPALAMIVATLAALVTADAWPAAPPPPAGRPRRWVAAAVAAGWAALTAAWVVPQFQAEAIRLEARKRIDRMAADRVNVALRGPELDRIRAAFARALRLDPRNAQVWSDEAYVDSLRALAHPADTVTLGADAEREADRAVRLCPDVAEFWIRKGTALDMQYRWVEGGDCFVRALRLAPARADVWYYQAYHLSLVPNEAGPARAAADFSLRLDPGFLLAQLLRQRLGPGP